jgi:hypothetical protein
MAVSARIAEQVVVDAARREFEAVEGRASAERDAREAVAAAERAQAELDTAIRTLAGIEDELAARERIKELRDARDAAREEAHRLSGLSASFTVNIAERWNELTLAEQRTAIRLTVDRAVVEPGRGAGRIRVETVREHPSRD